MTKTAIIRPAWTPATIALMVLGFVAFWPLGLAMLAYILWGDRLGEFKGDWSKAGKNLFSCGKHSRNRSYGFDQTGNVAFDEWRSKELERLAEERRKLEGLREEFDAYARELRRAKDQQEFDRFMAERSRNTPATRKPENDEGLTGLPDNA